MIRVNVLYPRTDGARFDWAYYTGTHCPMVNRWLGAALKGSTVEEGIAGGSPGMPPAFLAMAHMSFESVQAFEAAFAPHAAEVMADIPKFSSIAPIVQISEVKAVQ